MSSSQEETDFTSNQQKSLLIVGIFCNCLSIVGSLFIAIVYLAYKDVQTFALKLIFFLALSDIILSAGRAFSFEQFFENNYTPQLDLRCYSQSILITYGGLSTIITTMAISWSLAQSVINGVSDLNQYIKQYILVIFGIPLLISLVPLFTGDYGIAGFSCWISSSGKSPLELLIWRLGLFYVPLWLSIIFNFMNYFRIRKFFESLFNDESIESKAHKSMINKLTYYPIIMVICYIFGTINRVYLFFENSEILIIAYLHVSLGGMQGFFNAIVYGFNKQIKSKLSQCMCFNSNADINDTNRKFDSSEQQIESKTISYPGSSGHQSHSQGGSIDRRFSSESSIESSITAGEEELEQEIYSVSVQKSPPPNQVGQHQQQQ